MDFGAPEQAAHVPHGLFGRVGHFHARHSARIGQRAQERCRIQFRRLRHQLDRPLRRLDLETVGRLRPQPPHPPDEPGPRNPRTGVPRSRAGRRQHVALVEKDRLRGGVHGRLAARLAPGSGPDRRHQGRQGAFHQRRGHPRLPQVGAHRRGDVARAVQGSRPAGQVRPRGQPHVQDRRSHAGRRHAQQRRLHHPPLHRAAHLQRQRTLREQRHHHRARHPHRRRDGGFREATHGPAGRRAPLRSDGRERHLDQ